jgi:zinc transport system substrate-binding protein
MNTNQRRRLAGVVVGVVAGVFWAGAAGGGAMASPGAGQAPARERVSAAAPRVVVSIPPLRGLVEPMLVEAGLAREGEVRTLVPPGVSEHGYEIPPSTLAALNRADVVVLVGLGLEPQVEKFLESRPREGRVVVRAQDALGIEGEHEHVHEDADGDGVCDGHHGPVDPHVWLDPHQAERIVSAVAAALVAHAGPDEAMAGRIRQAEASMLLRVREVDRAYRERLEGAKVRTLVVGHDAWRHLGSRYNLTTVPIKGLTAGEPTPSSLSAAGAAIREKGARAVFVEPQLNQRPGRRIARSAGVEVLEIDPLGDGDWVKMMMTNLDRIARGLGVEGK